MFDFEKFLAGIENTTFNSNPYSVIYEAGAEAGAKAERERIVEYLLSTRCENCGPFPTGVTCVCEDPNFRDLMDFIEKAALR